MISPGTVVDRGFSLILFKLLRMQGRSCCFGARDGREGEVLDRSWGCLGSRGFGERANVSSSMAFLIGREVSIGRDMVSGWDLDGRWCLVLICFWRPSSGEYSRARYAGGDEADWVSILVVLVPLGQIKYALSCHFDS